MLLLLCVYGDVTVRETNWNNRCHRGAPSRRQINERSLPRWNSPLRILLQYSPSQHAELRSAWWQWWSAALPFSLGLPLTVFILPPPPAVIYLPSLCARSYQFYCQRSSAANSHQAFIYHNYICQGASSVISSMLDRNIGLVRIKVNKLFHKIQWRGLTVCNKSTSGHILCVYETTCWNKQEVHNLKGSWPSKANISLAWVTAHSSP